jgi:molybdenum cofactor cytidylyltransferase
MPTFGLIPAAGKSARMGQPKLLLPLGPRTVLEHVVAAVRAGGVADVLVVVAPESTELAVTAERSGAHVLRLAKATDDMRATCVCGLDWIEAHWMPHPGDGWLLLPADHPTSRPQIVRALLDAATQHPKHSIIVPVWQGRRGHPVWLSWRHVDAIRTRPAGQGLNAFVREWTAETLELAWDDAEILRDLDTPEDYRRLN